MLSAEKSAAQKVSEARKRKNRRLKQAKEEAQQEIEKFKGERERQFREHEAKNAGSKGETMGAILLCQQNYVEFGKNSWLLKTYYPSRFQGCYLGIFIPRFHKIGDFHLLLVTKNSDWG